MNDYHCFASALMVTLGKYFVVSRMSLLKVVVSKFRQWTWRVFQLLWLTTWGFVRM